MSKGQDELLRALHDEHAAVLWRFVVSLTGDQARSHDVVQETLLRAWSRPEVLDQSERSARAWLFTVARNLVIDQQRSASQRNEVLTEHLPDLGGADEAEAVLQSWIVAEALATLSAAHREVIVECYYQSRPINEVAGALGISAGTVKSRLHYGLRALRLVLQEMGVTE